MNVRWNTIIIGTLLSGVAFIVFRGMSKTHVEFILPHEFRGIFAIVERDQGVKPGRGPDGEWRFEIPENGILVTSDTSMLEDWHTEGACYSGGRILPQFMEGITPEAQHSLFSMETTSERVTYWFVGTAAELKIAQQSPREPLPEWVPKD